ncbi:MAG: glycoside hydrolase family 16 protein [Bacteroidales bacterium]|nr:glycoside hydrolase family 16 protein [Bacteroidales bacterium]
MVYSAESRGTRKKFLFLLSVIWTLFLAGCARQEDGWKLVWEDDFSGTELDSSSWSRVPPGKSDWNDMMSLREDLVYLEDGDLVLLGKVNDGKGADTTRFVTGGVSGKNKRFFPLARFEVRAKFNHVQGFWPALWLLAQGKKWPDGGEIDIMEHLNDDPFVYQTVHSDYSLHVNDSIPAHYTTAPVLVGDYNVYAVEVHPDSLCFSINGQHTLTYPRVEGIEGQFPWADCDFYFILSNQIGGGWVGPADQPGQFPTELRIDWVKVYQKKR